MIDITEEIIEVRPCYDDNNLESMQFKLSNNTEVKFINEIECENGSAILSDVPDAWYTLPGPLLGFEIDH